MSGIFGGPGLFWFGAATYIAMYVAALFWERAAQVRYLQLFKQRVDPNLPIEPQDFNVFLRRPWRWLLEAAPMTLRYLAATSKPQPDSVVEAARLEAARRRRVRWLVLILGIPIPVIASMLGAGTASP